MVAYLFVWVSNWGQTELYSSIPNHLGYQTLPWWWPLPLLTLSGLLVALVIRYLPGTAGHKPAEGFHAGGGVSPIELPGIFLAALATLILGAVLGPEAPLIAIGAGLGALAVKMLKRGAPPSATRLIAGAGSFAAISSLLGNPLSGAFLLMEASGLGGATMGLALIPGLLCAGVGALVFIGLDSLTGVGTFSLTIPQLPPFTTPTLGMFGWAIAAGLVCAGLAWLVRVAGLSLQPLAERRRLLATPVIGLGVGLIASAFGAVSGHPSTEVLFSGQYSMGPLVDSASTWSVAALLLLVVAKMGAYALSLSAFRGGPVFPSLFIGCAVGIAASHLPGLSLVPAIGMGIGAMGTGMLGLPLTCTLLPALLLGSDAVAALPLIIVAVVVSYVVTARLPEPADVAGLPLIHRPGAQSAA